MKPAALPRTLASVLLFSGLHSCRMCRDRFAVVNLIRDRVGEEEKQRQEAGDDAVLDQRVDLASAVYQQQQLDARGDADDE